MGSMRKHNLIHLKSEKICLFESIHVPRRKSRKIFLVVMNQFN